MFIFLEASVQPHTMVLYTWYKDTEEKGPAAAAAADSPRRRICWRPTRASSPAGLPCFSPEFVGVMDVAAASASSWVC